MNKILGVDLRHGPKAAGKVLVGKWEGTFGGSLLVVAEVSDFFRAADDFSRAEDVLKIVVVLAPAVGMPLPIGGVAAAGFVQVQDSGVPYIKTGGSLQAGDTVVRVNVFLEAAQDGKALHLLVEREGEPPLDIVLQPSTD